MTRPYVGVSGVMARSEAEALIAAWREAWAGREPTHDLAIEALASAKTLAGQPNKYPLRYPRIHDVASIFVKAPGVLNLVHYASDEVPGAFDVGQLAGASGRACHGFQFNVSWPDAPTLRALRSALRAPPRVVLQAGPSMLAECSAGASLAWKLKTYAGAATDVLIDASGGRGVPISVYGAAWGAQFIPDLCPDMGIGMAGGLCAEALADEAVGKMLRAGCSIDAEGRLRTSDAGGGHLDLGKATDYLRAAVRALTERPVMDPRELRPITWADLKPQPSR